jgi:hypothetical protein
MNESRKININIKDFNINNTTRKVRNKQQTENTNRIKVKPKSKPKHVETIKRKSILKMIRNHHEERNKMKMNNELNINQPVAQHVAQPVNDFNNEFKDAQSFFENLTIQNKNKIKPSNYTLKNNNIKPVATNSLLLNPTIDQFSSPTIQSINTQIVENHNLTDLSNTMNNQNQTSNLHINPYANIANPKYGCLKNGILPTYRMYQSQTRKNIPETINQTNNPINNTINNDQYNRSSIMHQHKQLQQVNRKKAKKQKRIVRRTYKIGKYKLMPKISVLVSNKTLRNNIIEQKQILKQISIQDIKKYLLKHGFIRVGTSAPNDILRKMYESMKMLCGEVHNHNPENLLYNFINDKTTL